MLCIEFLASGMVKHCENETPMYQMAGKEFLRDYWWLSKQHTAPGNSFVGENL